MSRIHEALKKAEQERAASRSAQLENTGSAADLMLEHSVAGAAEGAAVAIAPSLASAFTYDALLARCNQGQWNPDRSTMLFFNPQENARGMEQFRTLRSRLYHIRENRPLTKVLICSPLQQEGKSFVSANLAQVLVRQRGRRVLLIDADLREPRLHHFLGAERSPGLSEYLAGQSDEFGVIQRGPMENLFFVAAGHQHSTPAELVANGRLKLFLSRVESLFDWVLIDSPPAVPVSDASLLANFCDGVLLVVRSNVTPFDVARKARLEFKDKQLIGVVLNAVAENSTYSQYYESRYGQTQAHGN